MAQMSIYKDMSQTLTANRWYPEYRGAGRSYKSSYPTPPSILRASLGVEDYKWVCKTVTSEHIRAACVMPRGVPYAHLTNTPWSLVYTTPAWVMIMVSVADRHQWIDLCKSSGAIAWQCSHNMTYIYEWYEPARDEHGLEIKPPNPLGATEGRRSDFSKPKKKYDRSALIDDLRAELLTHEQLSDKYGITRQTIHNIAKREGMVRDTRRKDFATAKKDYDRATLVEDIRANTMTYAELGKKYDLKPISVQRIARVEGLTKPRQPKKKIL
jgi:hypothetical protein